MKQLIVLIFLMVTLTATAIAQVNMVRTGGTGYYLQIANGDTLNLSGQTPYYSQYHTALRDAINFAAGNDLEVYLRSDLEDRITAFFYDEDIIIEEIIDTVYITETIRDTVYVTEGSQEPAPLVQGFETELEHRSTDGLTTIHSFAYTSADSVHIFFDCNPLEDPLPRYKYGSGSRVVRDVFSTFCTGDLRAEYNFFSNGDTTRTYNEYWPHWMTQGMYAPGDTTGTVNEGESWVYTDFTNYHTSDAERALWEQTWGSLEYRVEDNTLIVDLLSRNIARLQWNAVPEHRNLMYKIKETLHASWSTGAHIGGRHSAQAQQSSVETYMHSEGLGVSVFSNGSWSNPHTFPFEWEDGDTVEYIVGIIDDTIEVKVWHTEDTEPEEWSSFSDPIIGSTSTGSFAIGSTGAGLYIIHEVEVRVLDN